MEYTSTITCKFDINNFEASSKKDYIEKVKNYFKENHSISLRNDEIGNIESHVI